MKLDDIDIAIMNELVSDAKAPLRSLALKVKTSFVTVMNRIRKLEKEGVIKKYTVELDHEKLGYGVHALIEVRIAKGKLLELEKRIARSPNIYAVYDITGGFDTVLIGRFKSTRTMDSFLKKIQTYDFIERTNTRLILNTIKEGSIRI